MNAPAVAMQVSPGSRLGPYEIVAPLESGGMASLFLARRTDAPHAAPVALKIVRPHLARDAGYVQMFIDEARLGARLVHPNIIRTEALGQHEGIHYLAMEYVNGVTLAQLIEWLIRTRRGLSPELAVHIAECIARGLHVAHELRDAAGQLLEVVHRDISPQNILLSYRGEVKLIDFGVAKSRGRNWATVEGSLKGKLGYMSPEQALGKPIDRRTDVYALGVVLWESLTHQRLFFGETNELLARVQRPQITPPRVFVPSLPQALDEVVMQALRPRVEERIATAADLADALGRSFPQIRQLDVDALGALVCLAMEEIRAKDDVDETLRDALKVAPPTQVRTAHALAAFTQERAPLQAPRVPQSSLERDAPLTRVSARPDRSPPMWVVGVVALVGLVVGTGLVGGTLWAGSRFLSRASSVPAPPALRSPAASPLPVMLPAPAPGVPTSASPSATSGGLLAPQSLPTGVEAPSDALGEVASDEARTERHSERRRRRREDPPTLPPPFIGSAGPPPTAEPSRSGPPRELPPSAAPGAWPPPVNGPEVRRRPVRIPPPEN